MRNVFGGLTFNLTRVAAEGAPGTSSHDCYDHLSGRRGNLNLVPYISMCKITGGACVFVCFISRLRLLCNTSLVFQGGKTLLAPL